MNTNGEERQFIGRDFTIDELAMYSAFKAGWNNVQNRVYVETYQTLEFLDGKAGEIRPMFEAFCKWVGE